MVGLSWSGRGVWKPALQTRQLEEEDMALREEENKHLLGIYYCGRHSALSRSIVVATM